MLLRPQGMHKLMIIITTISGGAAAAAGALMSKGEGAPCPSVFCYLLPVLGCSAVAFIYYLLIRDYLEERRNKRSQNVI